MVEFGKRLREECQQHPDWEEHCINYSALKRLIETKKHGRERPYIDTSLDEAQLAVITAGYQYDENESFEEEDSTEEVMRFRYALDREIEKAVLFVLQEQGSIAAELDVLAGRRAKFVDYTYGLLQGSGLKDSQVRSAMNELKDIHCNYAMAARLVLRFVRFVDLNVTAVRKILKKHDKITKSKLSHYYMLAYTNEYVDTHLDQLYNDGGLSSLVATLRRAFGELHHLEMQLQREVPKTNRGGNGSKKHRRFRSMPMSSRGSFTRQTIAFDSTSPSGHVSRSEHQSALVTAPKEPLMELIQLSRDKLKHNIKFVDVVAAQALVFGDTTDDEGADRPEISEMSDAQRISSFLNLMSTFLYMTNYYVVAPSVGQYLARVGSTENMAGIAIGMTPNAALIATVLYGWWSNHSYKSALLFAASCSVLGNITYALALNYDSISLVMIGRFLNGFGSARSINRRFIADTFSKRDRTAASAAFVTAGALGMACGPAIAALLGQLFTYSLEDKVWSIETAPGWIMLSLWTMYLVAAIVFFEEPDRSHIFGKQSTSVELTAKTNEDGEGKYLLADIQSSAEMQSTHAPPLYKNIPVIMTLWIYFVLKLVLESLLSSCPTLTKYFFGWESKSSGLFLACLGLLMFPANIVVARLSMRYEDRELIYSSLVAISLGIVGIISYTPPQQYSAVQYMLFAVCIFISTNALEGPNMGLLSKSIPKSWAKGIFNTGFLATEAGTAARSVGDVLITLASTYAGVSGTLNAIFVPMLGLVVVSVVLTRKHYDQMVEVDEDDDAKSNSS